MLHRVFLATSLLFALSFLAASAQELDIPTIMLSGGDLPHAITLAPADADAFRRRLNQLPRLEDVPAARGISYEVVTPYWATAFFLEDEEEDEGVEVGGTGQYFPDGGFVRLSLGDEEAWVIINLRQRAILDRYIRVAGAGQIGETPSTLAVLSGDQEPFTLEAGNELVDPETAAALLRTLVAANPSPLLEAPRPPPAGEGYWLTVTLLEGRSLRYHYDGVGLTEALGTERYDAAAARDILEAIAPASPPSIVNQEAPGSWLWWPLMVGGGLTVIALAVWLRRTQDTPAATR